MRFTVKFTESNQSFKPSFGEINNISDGGFERGYAAGYEEGRKDFELDTQEKTIDITKNGSVEVVPDEGYLLSKVTVSAQIASDLDVVLSGGSIKNIDSGITNVRSYALYGYTGVTSINLPNATVIGDHAIRGCTKLETFNAPKVTSIGSYAFYTDSKLQKVDFPALTSIPAQCFAICPVLATIILRSTTMVTLANTNAFDRMPVSQGTGYVYVPKSLVEQYKTATNWTTFANQIRAIEDYPEICGGTVV